MTQGEAGRDRDAEKLAELGYKQELSRAWSGFSNFAISFTIISVLAGCFTVYGQAWNNGGPIAISWAWPIICGIILIIALCMAELASAYPTAGGPYWWAAKLGGPGWSWFTGWANVLGLVAVVASVDYGAATFGSALLNLWSVDLGVINFADGASLGEIFAVFVVILAFHALVNIYSSHLVALFNNISVFVHVFGVAVIIAVLVFVPDRHQDVKFVFGHTINNSGFSNGMFWWYVLPIGFLLTMYTQTGYDASAHVSEETRGAALGAAKGVWRSVFWAGVIGWFVLLAITFAATDTKFINDPANGFGLGWSTAIFGSALDPWAAKLVVLIATVGQLFCGMACLTSASRMNYAFSRDRAVPGHRLWTRLNHHRVPHFSVLFMALMALLITAPALEGDENNFTYAFAAVVSIATIGLYIAYVIPVYLRWRKGDAWEPGPWTLGRKYKWINPAAVIWVAICVIAFSLPQVPAAVPWRDEFDWKFVNYAPLTVLFVIVAVGLWWLISARNTFQGPIREVATDDTGRVLPGGEAAPGAAPAEPT